MNEFSVKVVLFTGKTYSNGEHPILIRITKDRKVKYIGVGYTAKLSQWNKDKGFVNTSIPKVSKLDKDTLTPKELKSLKMLYNQSEIHPQHNKINSDILNLLAKIDSQIQVKKHQNIALGLNQLINLISEKEQVNEKSFLDFAKQEIALKLKNGDIRTYKRYKSVIKKLTIYLNNKDLTFDEVNTRFLKNYESYLKTSLKNHTNTIYTNFKTIRAILYSAIEDKLFEQKNNPFFSFKLTEDKHSTNKERLTFEEVQTFNKIKVEKGSSLFHAKNAFLFCFYNSGIRIGDLLELKWSDITKEGRLEYRMTKQGGEKSIKLRPESLNILKYYELNKKGKFIFHFLNDEALKLDAKGFTNSKDAKITIINKNLKVLAEMAGINKKLTTHIARHSFASIALKRKMPLNDIKNALGHSTLKQTETYLGRFDEEALDKSLDKVFKGI
jgi:integrase